jgi:class 3 adenylate cyclase
VIGPEVNLAARLVELTKSLPADIIMDERTYELAKDYIQARCLGAVTVQGLERPEVIYQALYGAASEGVGESPEADRAAPDSSNG